MPLQSFLSVISRLKRWLGEQLVRIAKFLCPQTFEPDLQRDFMLADEVLRIRHLRRMEEQRFRHLYTETKR